MSDYRSQSSSELSWSAVAGMIAGTILVVVAVIWMLNAASRAAAPPPSDQEASEETKAAPPEKRRRETQLEAEVKRLREEKENLERRRAELSRSEPTPQPRNAVERALAAGAEVEVSSGPFTKVGTNVAQVTFTLANPGQRQAIVRFKVVLYRDGEEVSSKDLFTQIPSEQEHAFSVLLATDGPGNYAASVDLESPEGQLDQTPVPAL